MATLEPKPKAALRSGFGRFWAGLRYWFTPPRTLKVTKLGRTYLVITVGVGLGALNTGNNLLYLLLGLMLSCIVVSGVLSEQCLRTLEVRRLGTDGAYAGEPFAFRYAVKRKKGRAFALTITEGDGGLEGSALVPYLEAGEERVVRANLTGARRGPIQLKRLKVSTNFPLGLFAKTRIYETPDVVLVYPRRGYVCAPPESMARGPVGDGGNPRRRDGDGDLLGLRELFSGEHARRIHWKKSATAGKLLRTEREREERRQYFFEVEATSGPPGEQLDRRCEEIAAFTHHLLKEGHEVGLRAGRIALRPSVGPNQERRILAALAWVGFEEPA
jgi:uncharacterized protein (DUF58 family)